MFADSVKESLVKLVQDYGTDVYQDAATFEDLLKDSCIEYAEEISMLIATLNADIVTSLIESD